MSITQSPGAIRVLTMDGKLGLVCNEASSTDLRSVTPTLQLALQPIRQQGSESLEKV